MSPLKLGRAPAVEIQYQLHQPKSLADRVGKVLDVGGVCADQDAHTYSNNMLFIVLIIIFPLADLSFWDDPLVPKELTRGERWLGQRHS